MNCLLDSTPNEIREKSTRSDCTGTLTLVDSLEVGAVGCDVVEVVEVVEVVVEIVVDVISKVFSGVVIDASADVSPSPYELTAETT